MKKLILTAALSSVALLLSACGDTDADMEEAAEDTAVVETADTTASADWPAGTRIVQEGDVTYRVDGNGTRVALEDGGWRIVTEDDVRYRVGDDGTRVRIDERGIDLDLDDVDVDLGTNERGNIDLDVSTDGTDAE